MNGNKESITRGSRISSFRNIITNPIRKRFPALKWTDNGRITNGRKRINAKSPNQVPKSANSANLLHNKSVCRT